MLRAQPAGTFAGVAGPEPHHRVQAAAQDLLGPQDRRDPALRGGREETAEPHGAAFLKAARVAKPTYDA